MSFHIDHVVLYSHSSLLPKRVVSLNQIGTTFITGDSGTGKSALIDVVDYALGSTDCPIGAGRVRNAAAWCGLVITFKTETWFIARRCPEPGKRTSSQFYLQPMPSIDPSLLPNLGDSSANLNRSGAVEFLSRLIDLPAIEARDADELVEHSLTIRHVAPFMFQSLDDLANRKSLFHKFDNYRTASFRAALLVVTGAVDEQYISAVKEAEAFKKRIRELKGLLNGLYATERQVVEDAQRLVLEAIESGLLSANDAGSDLPVETLRGTRLAGSTDLEESGGSVMAERIAVLEDEYTIKRAQYDFERDRLASLTSISRLQDQFVEQATDQAARLRTLELFGSLGSESPVVCPTCDTALSEGGESDANLVSSLRSRLGYVETLVESIPDDRRTLIRAVEDAALSVRSLKSEIRQLAGEMSRLRGMEEGLNSREGLLNGRMQTYGRISHFLDSVPTQNRRTEIQEEITVLEAQVEDVDTLYLGDSAQRGISRVEGQLSKRIQAMLTAWGGEYSNFPVYIDLMRVTAMAVRPEGIFPMRLLTGTENIEFIHLACHLALHEMAVSAGRPMPRLLILDQPSTAYFPDETEMQRRSGEKWTGDMERVASLLQYIQGSSQAAGFQVLVLEHADFSDRWFQDAVFEKWSKDRGLIPTTWPDRLDA